MTRSSSIVLDLYDGGPGDQWLDHSVHRNNGTLVNGVTRAPLFDSETEIMNFVTADSQYVDCGKPASLALSAAATLLVWVNINTTTGAGAYRHILGKESGDFLSIIQDANDGGFLFVTKVGGAWVNATISSSTSTNTWVFLAGTFDSSLGSNELQAYYNGAYNAQATAAGNLDDSSAVDVTIGGALNRYFDGLIYRPRILTRPLSEPKIAKLFQKERGIFGA